MYYVYVLSARVPRTLRWYQCTDVIFLLLLSYFFFLVFWWGRISPFIFVLSSFGVQDTANVPILTVDHRVFSFPSTYRLFAEWSIDVKYWRKRGAKQTLLYSISFYIRSSTFFFTSETKLRYGKHCLCLKERVQQLFFLLRYLIRRVPDPRL